MSEKEIQRLLDQYSFKTRIFGNTILVNSKFDEWLIEVNIRIIILKHQSTRHNKTSKFKSHVQCKFTPPELDEIAITIQDDNNGKYLFPECGITELTNTLDYISQHDHYTSNHKHSVPSIMRKFQEINAFS